MADLLNLALITQHKIKTRMTLNTRIKTDLFFQIEKSPDDITRQCNINGGWHRFIN